YHAGRWFAPGDNPLRVGPVAVGSIYQLPTTRGGGRMERWMVEAFLNGVMAAAVRNPATGRWEDRVISGRSDRAVIRRLADDMRREIAVLRLLQLDDEAGDMNRPTLPDVCR
ncbi:hypothetical protein DY926_16740, partial [Komagataeibacter melaceti]